MTEPRHPDELEAENPERPKPSLAHALRRIPEVMREQEIRQSAVTLAVQFSAAPGKGGNIHQMLEWADEINAYLVDGSLKGKEA